MNEMPKITRGMDNISSLDLVYSLTNKFVLPVAKKRLKEIELYFKAGHNFGDANNKIVDEIIKSVREYELKDLTEAYFQAMFNRVGLTAAETQAQINKIKEAKMMSRDRVRPILNEIKQICSSQFLNSAISKFSDGKVCRDADGLINYIKNSDFRVDIDSINPHAAVNFRRIDVDEIQNSLSNNSGTIPSGYKFINDSSYYNGYRRGQMVLVCAPPGTGKSLFLMGEAAFMANRGYKVLYFALGDLCQEDFVVRISAITTGSPFSQVYKNFKASFLATSEFLRDNLYIVNAPAGVLDAGDILDKVDELDKNGESIDVVVIDYDGNLKGASDGESMYNNFGNIYAKLNQLVLKNKLLMIAAQPKVDAWGNPDFEMRSIGESSRKQHTADMIIGFGTEPNVASPIHKIRIVKNRRGRMTKCFAIRRNNGRFLVISESKYSEIKQDPSRDYSAESEALLVEGDRGFREINRKINSLQNN